MEDNKTPVEVLLERGQAYIITTLQLFKLKGTDKIAEIVSSLASGFVILMLLLLLFVNLNIGIALLFGEVLGKIWLGFLVLSGFYGVVALITYLFRNYLIKKRVRNAVINTLLKDEQFQENEQ